MTSQTIEEIVPGYRHRAISQCSSTNTLCMEAATSGEPGNLWLTAETQTAGKGSRGRSWISEPGNLFASLLLEHHGEPEFLPQLTFVAALAVHELLEELLPHAEIKNKWPNDVLIAGRKVSGILLEAVTSGGQTFAVIGFGINCQHHPADTLFPATDLRSNGADVGPEYVFPLLATSVHKWLKIWDQGSNFDTVREAWLGEAWNVGSEVAVGLRDGSRISGIFAGLTSEGHIRICGDEENILAVGDIFAVGAQTSGADS